MAKVLTEDRRTTAHYIVSEASGYRSREAGLVAAGSGTHLAGTVMGRVSATSKFVPFNPAAADGSEVAERILYEGCDATTADVRRTFTARDTEVVAEALIWAEGVTDEQKTTALSALAARGIIAR